MKRRIEKDIWRGLNDFYLVEAHRKQKPETLVKKDKVLMKASIIDESRVYKHVLSHQKLMVKFITVQSPSTEKHATLIRTLGMKWLTKSQVEKIPKPILIERFLKEKIHDQDFW